MLKMRQGFSSKWLAIGCLIYGFSAVAASETAPAPATTPATENPAAADNRPFIGVILPLQSKTLGPLADAIKAGMNAAVALDAANATPVRFYPANEQTDDVLFVYRQARDEGARVIVGPLTKPAITELSKSDLVSLPTIVLNTLEPGSKASPSLYTFGLGIDSEARQIARQAFAEGKRKALSVALDSAFSKRLQTAFNEEWKQLGGELLELQLNTNRPNYSLVRSLREENGPDMAFVALDAKKAKALRPYLGELPVYATSQISNGRPNSGTMRALAGVAYVEMPWFLDPKAANVAKFARPAKPLHIDVERMYVFGIDAYRLAVTLAQLPADKPAGKLLLDGVSGKIELGPQRSFVRTALPSVIGSGEGPAENSEPNDQ